MTVWKGQFLNYSFKTFTDDVLYCNMYHYLDSSCKCTLTSSKNLMVSWYYSKI